MTWDLFIAISVIVVREFFAAFEILAGDDPDRTVDDVGVAIGCARMVDESGDVAANVAINDPPTVDAKTPDLSAPQITVFPLLAFLGPDLFTRVRNDALVLVDILHCKDAPTVQL